MIQYDTTIRLSYHMNRHQNDTTVVSFRCRFKKRRRCCCRFSVVLFVLRRRIIIALSYCIEFFNSHFSIINKILIEIKRCRNKIWNDPTSGNDTDTTFETTRQQYRCRFSNFFCYDTTLMSFLKTIRLSYDSRIAPEMTSGRLW